LAAATLDMNWHTVSNEADFKPTLVLKTSTRKIRIISKRSAYKIPYSLFCAHLSGGYSLLCVYLVKTLDYNVYDWMKANGGLTRENSERQKIILSVGNSGSKQSIQRIHWSRYGNRTYLRNAGL
jgi:peptidyl-dipeptidase Dcp